MRSAADVFALTERLLDDATEREGMGGRARKTVEQNRGASARTAERVDGAAELKRARRLHHFKLEPHLGAHQVR